MKKSEKVDSGVDICDRIVHIVPMKITEVEYTNKHNPLYSVALEDGPGVVADFQVLARGEDGVSYVHNTAYEPGVGSGPDGFPIVVRWSPKLQKLVERIRDRGVIDLRYWSPLQPYTDSFEY